MNKDDENRLIERIKGGDYQRFEDIIAAYQGALFAFLYKMVKDADDARDLCQDTFFKAYTSIRSFKGEAKFSTWLFRIGYRRALNFIKKNKKRGQLADALENSPCHNSGFSRLESEEMTGIIEGIIREMPPKYRAALYLFYKEQKRYHEIAAIMNIPINTVKSHISRAKDLLRQRLAADHGLKDIIN